MNSKTIPSHPGLAGSGTSFRPGAAWTILGWGWGHGKWLRLSDRPCLEGPAGSSAQLYHFTEVKGGVAARGLGPVSPRDLSLAALYPCTVLWARGSSGAFLSSAEAGRFSADDGTLHHERLAWLKSGRPEPPTPFGLPGPGRGGLKRDRGHHGADND